MQPNQYEEKEYETQDQTSLLIQLGQIPIKCLKLSKRSANTLMRSGIMTIDDLTPLSPHDLFLIPGMGKKTLAEIQNALQQALNSPASYIGASLPAQPEQPAEVFQQPSQKP
jgi:DNA-directed RNA polymerase alpha subunit